MVKVLQSMFLPFHDHAISSSNSPSHAENYCEELAVETATSRIIYMKDQQEKKKYWKGDMKVQDGP